MRAWRSARSKQKASEAAEAARATAAIPAPVWPPRDPMPRVSFDGPSVTSGPIHDRWMAPPVEMPPEPVAESRRPAWIEAPVEALAMTPAESGNESVERPAEVLVETAVESIAEAIYEQPDEQFYEPPAPEPVAQPVTEPVTESVAEPAQIPVTTLRLVPSAPAGGPTPEHPAGSSLVAAPPIEPQAEFLRLLEVVTRMCDHVIDYIEADRVERRLMIETLSQLARLITDGAAATVKNASAPVAPAEARERLIGGSMEAGPDPVIDLRQSETPPPPRRHTEPAPQTETVLSEVTEIAVEVRGRFGDRWVDGFEICEVMMTPDGPRYRLRRHRDGVVLPELFDATSIRHIETFEELKGDQLNDSPGRWSRS